MLLQGAYSPFSCLGLMELRIIQYKKLDQTLKELQKKHLCTDLRYNVNGKYLPSPVPPLSDPSQGGNRKKKSYIIYLFSCTDS